MDSEPRKTQVEGGSVEMEASNDLGFAFHISDKWAHCYPNVEVAVVTSIDKPPAPPDGYVPLRLGVRNQIDALDTDNVVTDEDIVGFSTDTVLWNEELLEARLEQITEWTRHAPLSLREKLDRINWLINTKVAIQVQILYVQPISVATATRRSTSPPTKRHVLTRRGVGLSRPPSAMTSLLLHWLNEELALHRKVNVVERDLCNGYIFAEILHLHGLENHLERYTDGADLSIRVANLELFDSAMVAGGLGPLGATTKRQIMMENRSCILQLLLRMKEFLKSKRTKVSAHQQKLRSTQSKVYEPRAPVEDPTRVVQDVEERFIKETAKQYEPTEVRFYKDVNSAIYLRKFPQARWQAENDQIEYEKKMKAGNATHSGNSMTALRTHMDEKRAFMKDWDKQRLEKWQRTQNLFVKAERDDLRLELTLEERRRRFQAAKLAEIQVDSTIGVVGFEKNMNRLGLSNGGGTATEPGLRAIPAADPGALAHLDRLHERVEELGFRPSNNVQMMKELRGRRTAQLAAEKDRRMRRMKTASESSKMIQLVDGEASDIPAAMDDHTPPKTDASRQDTGDALPINIQDAFIDANREALEANYAHLNEIGATKRELDMNELQRLRCEKRSKIFERTKEDCASIVSDLVSLSIASLEYDTASEAEAIANWKRKTWLDQSSSFSSAVRNSSPNDDGELQVFTQTFLDLSNVWEAFIEPRPVTTHRFASSIGEHVESLIKDASSTPSPDVLETQWTKLETSKFVAVFTSDDRAHQAARAVSRDHCLHYVNLDDLAEECIKNSYDPAKQADTAASLGRRERELGVFGPRITALRQKNSLIPEALAVEIVLAFVNLTQPAAPAEPDEAGVQDTSDDSIGVLLHNFPRTLEEWKLFEKSVINVDAPKLSEEATTERLASLESAVSVSPSEYTSVISCAVVVSFWEPMLSRTPSPTTSELTPTPSATELSANTSDRRRPADSSKRQIPVDPATAKAEAEQETLQKRRQVEDMLARTSRTIRIDQEDMHERVLQELIHLAVDVYANDTSEGGVGKSVECGAGSVLPPELETARANRRSGMKIKARVAWMVVANELQLSEETLLDAVKRLSRLEQTQSSNLRKLFSEALHSLETETSSTRAAYQRLDDTLGATAVMCSAVLERTRRDLLSSPSSRTDKIHIATEVALGDAVDVQRIAANEIVDEIATDPHPSSRPHLLAWLQLLPLVCLEIKEFVVDTVHTLSEGFYSQFGFLRADSAADVLQAKLPRKDLDEVVDAAKALDSCCHENGLQISLQGEVLRIVAQLASAAAGGTNTDGGYELGEASVAKELAHTALRRMTAILRWSAKLVESIKGVHAADVEAMRHYISRDLSRSNMAIGRVMKQLASEGVAAYPEGEGLEPGRERSLLLRHHRAALLSASQVDSLIQALANSDGSTTIAYDLSSLARDEFIAAVVAVARRKGFPDVWQDFNNVARVAIAWSSDTSPRVPWRHFVVALILTHVGDFPTIEALDATTDELRRLAQPSRNDADNIEKLRIPRADFVAQSKLWFEDSLLPPEEATTWKSLIISLFVVDASPNEAEILPMLLALCAAPATSRRVRIEFTSTLLPRSSRGLQRALAVFSRWTASPSIITMQLRSLLVCAGVAIDETQLAEVGSSCRRDDLLAWCEAYDPAIAERFIVHDTLAALVDE